MSKTFSKGLVLALSLFISTSSFSSAWSPENRLRVLTLNTGALAPFGKLTNTEAVKRVKGICHELSRSSFDVVLLQEVWTSGYRKMFRKCGFPYSYHQEVMPGLIRKRKKGLVKSSRLRLLSHLFQGLLPNSYGFDMGLMILSRFPIRDMTSFRFSENGKEEFATIDGEFPVSKGALGGRLQHPYLGDVFVANTHLVSHYGQESYRFQREQQLKELRGWLKETGESYPVVVGGDFNISPPRENGEGRFRGTHRQWNTFQEIFSDYRQFSFAFETMTTYPGPTNAKDEGVLDHLLVKGSLEAKKGSVEFQKPIPCGKRTLCQASDHFGLSTEFISSKKIVMGK